MFLFRLLKSARVKDRFSRSLLVAISYLSVAFPLQKGMACGIEWNEPKSHFDGVDYQGHVMLVEHLGEIDAGRGLKLPFYAVFGSNSGNNSPYAGYGWTVPLLEARIVQVDEGTFKLDQPDGWFRLFWRVKNSPNILQGQGGWKAEIRGDTITAWADCGSKLTFSKGWLVSMQLKDRRFDFVHERGRVAAIREAGRTILRVEEDTITGAVKGFWLNDSRRIWIERTKRPRVQIVNHQKLVSGMDLSLSKITTAPEMISIINYAVDENLNPTLRKGNRLVVWDASSKKIIRDDAWRYEIDKEVSPFDSAAIKRTKANGQSEFWHNDSAKGIETIQVNATKKVTYRFSSGILAGLVRQMEETRDGTVKSIYKAFYDENGHLIREVDKDGNITTYITQVENGETIVRAMENGIELWSEHRSLNGRTANRKYRSGFESEVVEGSEGGRSIKIKLANGRKRTIQIDSIGCRKVVIDEGKGGIEYYDSANKLLRKIDSTGNIVDYVYNFSSNALVRDAFMDAFPREKYPIKEPECI